MLRSVAKFKQHTARGSAVTMGHFSKFLCDPAVSLSLLVLGLAALVLAVLNFVQAMVY